MALPNDDLAVLRAVPYFRSLPAEELGQLQHACRPRRLETGEIVLLEGAPSPALYIVRSGGVAIYKTSLEGKEQVLRTVRPGETFNDVPAFDGGPNPAGARALAPDTVVWELPAARLAELLASHPLVALEAARVLAGRLRTLLTLVEDLSFRHIVQRLARLILEEASTDGRVALTQQEMAARVGTAREVVSRALRDLERRGAITREHHRIVRLDAPRLRALLEAPAPESQPWPQADVPDM